jgi:ATP-dependent Clp protease adaptor protein ClpS
VWLDPLTPDSSGRPARGPLRAGICRAAPWASAGTTERPDSDVAPGTDANDTLEPGYLVIVWNDPVNLMAYVTHVFMKVFGWSKTRAEKHMLEVHERGKSVVARESFERAEFYVHQLQRYSLQATLERDE